MLFYCACHVIIFQNVDVELANYMMIWRPSLPNYNLMSKHEHIKCYGLDFVVVLCSHLQVVQLQLFAQISSSQQQMIKWVSLACSSIIGVS